MIKKDNNNYAVMVRLEDEVIEIKSSHKTLAQAIEVGISIKEEYPTKDIFVYDNIENVEHIIY